MNADELDYKRHHISVTAGMNQRYHQSRARWWSCWNRGVQIAVGVLAVIGVCLSVAASTSASTTLDAWSVVVASLAAIAAIALNVLPLGDWARDHHDLFRRWSDLREDIDALPFDMEGDPTPELVGRLKTMDAKVHRICAAEPGCRDKLLTKCYRDEVRSREDDAIAPCPVTT